ncbi:MAG: NAD(P)-binding domain-containing protein, partial [Actinobacteria bacterium]|nr:NAD(P)-binding domain-containing protein [Actinomycetota bacterium]
MTTRAAVIGAGSWGTTVASLLAPRVSTVLWSRRTDVAADIAAGRGNRRYLAGFDLPGELEATADLAEAVSGADVVVVGVPTHGFRETLAAAGPTIAAGVPVGSPAQGLEQGTPPRLTPGGAQGPPGHPGGGLSGPHPAPGDPPGP